MATTNLFTDVELITTGTASIEKALFVHGDPLTRRPDPEAQGLDICRTIFPDKIYYAINVHAWPPSNLIGQFAYSAAASPPSSTTTFASPLLLLLGRVLTNKLQKIMGNCLAKPPPVVLVPPLFDYPPLLARNSMLESSYDFLFGKLALKCLFEDYFEVKDADHFSAKFMLKPTDDPHVDLVASVSSVVDAKVEGDASFRWQRVLRVRSSGFYPKYGIGAFLVSPLISEKNDKLSDEHGIMGLSYASTNLSLGAIVSPFSTKEEWPKNAWLVRKMGRLTVGVQYEPLCDKSKDTEKYRDLRNWSCAASYGLGSRSPLNPSFNVGLELTRNSQFIASFYQHLVVQRVDDSKTSNSLSDSSLQMAASWQANKNFLLKGKVGALSSTFTLAFKSWWNPSFTFNITATNNHRTGRTACGFGLRVDNLREAGSVQSVFICFHISMFCIFLIIKSPGICSYQRADPNFVMLTPNKEHLAKGTVRKMGERPMFLSKL
ncbi:hypothetical protein YC2023_019756 [Brassica napus]